MLIIADVAIFGSCPNHLIELRMSAGKLSFLYSERFFKRGMWRRYIPTTHRKIRDRILKYGDGCICVLAASAFLPWELSLMGFSPGKVYKWGYFPKKNTYFTQKLLSEKSKSTILWAGRFLDWKHPDDVITIAKRLKDEGYDVTFNIAGNGEMESALVTMITKMNLSDTVHLLGGLTPEQVRGQMEKAGIYLFTSDRNEGWGAVLNESMNSGCAVVASHAIGAVPYLMKHNENGLIYKSGDVDGLYQKVKYLLDNPGEQERLGRAAYETITGLWNAEVAAQRLITLSEHLLAGEKYPNLYEDGPCSQAEIIKDQWF